ncbi:MAG: hypothetical protein ACXWQE_02855 [Bdellovibrionales bacterium]
MSIARRLALKSPDPFNERSAQRHPLILSDSLLIINPMIRQRLESVIVKISPNIEMTGDLSQQLDSLQLVFLLDEVEKEFSISFSTAELFNLRVLTVEGLEKAISWRQSRV